MRKNSADIAVIDIFLRQSAIRRDVSSLVLPRFAANLRVQRSGIVVATHHEGRPW
jgi:hypothetical protein